ncbi:MAG TPA: riboflavin biosynthesis protein RibF [Spirochaetota bacterium]|nr:riboflavin biosynthesis protein RibF [Spirochaetota bacterium]
MRIFKNLYETKSFTKSGIVALGYFDALHLGHRYLLKKLVELSEERGVDSFVLTYPDMPKKNYDNRRVIDLKYKIDEIKKIGVKNLILCNYDESFYSMVPTVFLSLLKKNFNITGFLVGKDFSFGKDREGNVVTLLENGFSIDVVEPFTVDDKYLSTGFIKNRISEGDIDKANNLLGRPFFIEGIVRKGKQLGRKLGFPTMNVRNDNICYPAEGSYATVTSIKDKKYFSMTYVSKDIIETHLFNYDDFRYNFKIKIDFFKKIRDNQRFEDMNGLIEQLFIDLSTVKRYFNL